MGCKFVGSVEEMITHVERECPFAVFTYLACNRRVQRNQLEDHQASCDATLPCDICRAPLLPRDRESHTQLCLAQIGTTFKCDACEQCLPEGPLSMKAHLEECPEREEICQVEGCGMKMKRKHMDKHMQDYMRAHMSFLEAKLREERKMRSELEHQNLQLRQEEKKRKRDNEAQRRAMSDERWDVFWERLQFVLGIAKKRRDEGGREGAAGEAQGQCALVVKMMNACDPLPGC
uniref:TRAF-type domain-containing protein n=1 Tax=Chromera velia CCMP2878 TaxID=1169474 RepID=A0A0G4FMH5_9ALVE|eukprot:Cvel_17610.t1-p1 / transcript=Cvel_17610.t1 / gene=Cvel_17610 / organism=Chromera_velia_CCMP2878 / gene_product=TNF receptor-associated factor family protein, putative / transcript_product=TNF receptor-associated factor family protein, putative / location=Cvel_scaffold1416:27991-29808(-) / protein_length=232 / sequence_SO=supercontig / SO=protein_coding / is_pseudo=false